MYTTTQGLNYVIGITIVQDTGILSDHDMVISKLDLGIESFSISTEKEEWFNFWQIMNIPMIIKPGHNHPTLNENVFKGTEYQYQKKLFLLLQETCHDTQLKFMEKIQEIKADLVSFENDIITRKLATISADE
jgi:hypothetical protein